MHVHGCRMHACVMHDSVEIDMQLFAAAWLDGVSWLDTVVIRKGSGPRLLCFACACWPIKGGGRLDSGLVLFV